MNFCPASHLFLLSDDIAPRSVSFAADRVVGTNATLESIAGTRSAGVGGAAMAVDEDYLELSENPYQLARVQNGWAAFSMSPITRARSTIMLPRCSPRTRAGARHRLFKIQRG